MLSACIWPSTSLNFSAPAFASDSAPVPASTLLHSPAKAVLSPSTLLYRVCSTSPRDAPLSISWAKLWPVSLCKILLTADPVSPSSFSIDLV